MTRIASKLRRDVIKRAKGYCEYCRSNSAFSDSPFDVEHIIPIAAGGKTISANLALSCHGCNLHKSSKTEGFDVVGEETARLFHPRNDVWDKHFVWAENFSVIVGLTPTGRSTVETLKLNRKGLANQRKMLYLYGKHPPK